MGFFDKIKEGLKKTTKKISENVNLVFANFRQVDEELLEELEERLVLSDMSVKTVNNIMESIRKDIKIKNIKEASEVKELLKEKLVNILNVSIEEEKQGILKVILVFGVNGVGKTTTIGKLAKIFKDQGKNVIIGAADTFRAAAREQIEEWGKRANVPVIRGADFEDPASVVFKTCEKGISENADVIIIDTAGRLHNKENLMKELDKINRTIDKALVNSEYVKENVLILDGTTGQNALSQAKGFNEVAKISSIIITKLDGTSKGGVVFSIVNDNNIPIKYIGIGEGIDDLVKFDSENFVNAILDGEENEQNG